MYEGPDIGDSTKTKHKIRVLHQGLVAGNHHKRAGTKDLQASQSNASSYRKTHGKDSLDCTYDDAGGFEQYTTCTMRRVVCVCMYVCMYICIWTYVRVCA